MSQSDLPSFLDSVQISSYAWRGAIRFFAIYVAATGLLESGLHLEEEDRNALERVAAYVENLVHIEGTAQAKSSTGSLFGLLVYFFRFLQDQIDVVIGHPTNHGLAVLLAMLTKTVIDRLAAPPPEPVQAATAIVSRILAQEGRRILITLDRFDDYFDKFYASPNGASSTSEQNDREQRRRRQFLSSILEGLILAARDIKREADLDWLDLLFTVPWDKFLELHLRERAQLEQTHVVPLWWHARELYEFVGRRIAYGLNLREDEWSDAWATLFPPTIQNSAVPDVREDSFLYLLRHSLWRPRELQMYISEILQDMRNSNSPASEALVKRAVQNASLQIVRREFVEEFRGEYANLNKVLRKLEHADLSSVMEYAVVCDKLRGASLSAELDTADNVVLRLYFMGIVGVRSVRPISIRGRESTVQQQRQEVLYRFAYNSLETDPFAPDVSVVFHPLFFDALGIKHAEPFVVNELRWEMFGGRPESRRNPSQP